MEEGTEKHRLYHCQEWDAMRRGILEVFRKWEQQGENIKERMEMAERYGRTPSQRKPVEQRTFQNEDVGI